MRIALVVERFDPAGGGVESACWQIAHGLAEAGERVTVIAREAVGSPSVSVQRIPAPTAWQPLFVATFQVRSTRALERSAFDLVHGFCRNPHVDVFHAGGGSHAEYLDRSHGAFAARLRRASPRHALQLALERRIFRTDGPHIQCVSEMVRNEVATRHGVKSERLSVVPYGIDAARFAPERSDGSAFRKRLANGAGPVWLFPGSGFQRKGLDTALQALAACKDPQTQLWVAGRDRPRAWRAQADALGIGPRVHFLGPVDDMPGLYKAADGVLFPTRYDAFGLVLLEAAAAGCPIITSRRAGAAPLVAEASRILEDADDVAGFAAALDELSDPIARGRLAAAGPVCAARHPWSRVVSELRDLYAKVARTVDRR